MDADDFSQALETVRAFIRDQVVPREEKIAEKDEIPRDIWQQAAALGLFGYALPVEYGRLGLGSEIQKLVIAKQLLETP